MSASAAPRRGRPPANRDKLVEAARTCLATKGYAATTARDLVEASGTNLASIGYHFGTKDALLNEAIARDMEAWAQTVRVEVLADGASGLRDRLARTFAVLLDRLDELRPWLLAFVEGFPPAVRDDDLRATMRAAYAQVRAAGSEMLERAFAEDGVVVDARRAEVLASVVVAIFDGLILQWLVDPEAVPTSQEVMAALEAAFSATRATP